MKHAITKYINKDQTAAGATTAAASSKSKQVQQLDAASKGRKRNQERQKQISTGGCAAHGFLRTTFMPLLEEDEAAYCYSNCADIERDFYQSLSQVANKHNIQLVQSQLFDYPYNIAIALANLEGQLHGKIADGNEYRLIHHEGSTFFAQEQRYNTGSTLYYIPIAPLFMMLNDRRRRRTAHLLLSVCCYLYRIADIPYHRQEGSYLCGMYETLLEWNKEQYPEGDPDFQREYRNAEYIGDIMAKKLCNPMNLNWFTRRLKNFKCEDSFDNECDRITRAVYELYSEYPTTPLDQKFHSDSDRDYEGYTVSLDKYISFYAGGRGELAESLLDTINSDLQEYGSIDEPLIYVPIDGRIIEGNNLDFEEKLFRLIGDLATLLYDYEQNRL